MIIQLPNGRIIECSVELYLSLTDTEVNELNGLGPQYTKENVNPFYNSYAVELRTAKHYYESDEEYEPKLDEINDEEKRLDSDYFSDDI